MFTVVKRKSLKIPKGDNPKDRQYNDKRKKQRSNMNSINTIVFKLLTTVNMNSTNTIVFKLLTTVNMNSINTIVFN
jgi:hypothetical protein